MVGVNTKELPSYPPNNDPTWMNSDGGIVPKTVWINGWGQKTLELLSKATETGVYIDALALNALLDAPEPLKGNKPEDIHMRSVQLAELGIAYPQTLEDIYTLARRQGLLTCPAAVVLNLRLEYVDQPEQEVLHIATMPFTTPPNSNHILALMGTSKSERPAIQAVSVGKTVFEPKDFFAFRLTHKAAKTLGRI